MSGKEKINKTYKIIAGLFIIVFGMLASHALANITPETLIKSFAMFAFLNVFLSIIIILLGDNNGNL